MKLLRLGFAAWAPTLDFLLSRCGLSFQDLVGKTMCHRFLFVIEEGVRKA